MAELVSIITPMFNSERFIVSTIKSVQAQTYDNWEMIIVDDGSTDNSVGIIQDLILNDSRVKLHMSDINKGVAYSRNIGLQSAKGKYIAFLDSDDLWYAKKLQKQIAFMKKNNYHFTFTSFARINEKGAILNNKLINAPMQVSYNNLLKSDYIGCLTAMFDVSAIGKIYMPEIIKGQDYCCWLNILKHGRYAYYLKEQLAYYRVRNKSISSNKISAIGHQWRIYRNIEQLPLMKSLFFLFFYIYNGVNKRLA